MDKTIFKKHIRSFVRRQGRLTRGQQHALKTLWPRYGIEFSSQSIDLQSAFETQAPYILEIGFGNGEALAQMAGEHPNLNFIGIEVHRPGVGHLLHLIESQQLKNIRIVCHDAAEFLRTIHKQICFQQISIFFPDPWPKKRHHKRRLIQPEFVSLLETLLIIEGILHIATDWSDYVEHIETVMHHQPNFKETNLHAALKRPTTKFEHRGVRKGHVISDLVYQQSKHS